MIQDFEHNSLPVYLETLEGTWYQRSYLRIVAMVFRDFKKLLVCCKNYISDFSPCFFLLITVSVIEKSISLCFCACSKVLAPLLMTDIGVKAKRRPLI